MAAAQHHALLFPPPSLDVIHVGLPAASPTCPAPFLPEALAFAALPPSPSSMSVYFIISRHPPGSRNILCCVFILVLRAGMCLVHTTCLQHEAWHFVGISADHLHPVGIPGDSWQGQAGRALGRQVDMAWRASDAQDTFSCVHALQGPSGMAEARRTHWLLQASWSGKET